MAEPIGATLKQRREARHLSIEQVAGQTRIRTHYLLALENDDLSAIPSMPQARGLLRIYAEFLGLNPAEISSLARSDESQRPIPQTASPAEALMSPAPSNAPVPDTQPSSTFFGGLRERFARRSSVETVVPQPEPALPSEPEPEPFVPIRVHEELPAASEEISEPEPQPIAEPESAAKPVQPRKRSGRKTSTKKPVEPKDGITKTAKPLGTGADKKAQVKKKDNGTALEENNLPEEENTIEETALPGARLLAVQTGFLSSTPPMVESGPPASEVFTSDEKPPEEASSPEETEQINIETGVESAAPVEERMPIWRAWLSRLRFKSTRARQDLQDEVGEVSETHAEGIESNVKEFNPVMEPAASVRSSQEIFEDLGRQLRERREMLSLTIEEVERHIHVRAVLLHALEQGAMQELPSPVQTRGMFANYASFLDLDVDTLLLRFADGLQARHRERYPQKPPRGRPIKVNEKVPPLSGFAAGDLLIGGGMIILLILFTIWGLSRVVVMRSQYYPQVTAPAISNILVVPSIPALPQEVTLIPAQATSLPLTPVATIATGTLPANINVELNVMAVERTYMRVTVDGKVQFDGQAVPGTVYPYEAKTQVEILVGSASGLSITYNGRSLGLMGTFGQVVDNIYTAQGIQTPTATPLPSPTATPRFSPTPSRTPTLVPTPTSGK